MPRLASNAPRIVSGVVGIAIVGQLAGTMHALVGVSHSAPGVLSRAAVGAQLRPRDLNPAVSTLFGVAPVSEPIAAAVRKSLILTGVIATGDPALGLGILGVARDHTMLYRVGAVLPDTSQLVAVYADRVELDRGGHREILHLWKSSTLGLRRTVALNSQESVESTDSARAIRPHRYSGEAPRAPAPEEGVLASADYWVANHLGWEQKDQAGRFIGYELAHGKRPDGLRSGDVLTGVSGTAITDRDQAAELLATSAGGPVTVTVLRSGTPVQVTLPDGVVPLANGP
jgi:type II secretory pathway component PulC